jgi:glycine betaine/proline transport system permease protein
MNEPLPNQEAMDDISTFVRSNPIYYRQQFDRLDAAKGFVFSFNVSAALLGPIWFIIRRLWGMFWVFLILETAAIVQLSRGIFADLGKDEYARAERLSAAAKMRLAEADEALAAGADNATALAESAKALAGAAKDSLQSADAITATAPSLVIFGIVLLLVLIFLQGALANHALNNRFQKWQADRTIGERLGVPAAILMVIFILCTYLLTAYRYTSNSVPNWILHFPADSSLRGITANLIDRWFQWMGEAGGHLFAGITSTIRTLLDAMETLLLGTPWLIVTTVIILLALKLASIRVAIFTAAALAYLMLLGFWEKSMMTVALLGSAAILCLVFGIPLGILCARKKAVYAVIRPVLDFMQTMPSFVYLIPVIAFFGIGKPPGILATIVFGMPPVVRLTVLGLDNVPSSVREAAEAFGVSKSYMLLKVDLPLAMPSIMTGVNQTILMCLSMVVVASLIGAKGLGEEVLDALMYANEGQGVLAGLAILFCAMILDRIVQGKRHQGNK